MRVTKKFLPDELQPHWAKIRQALELIASSSGSETPQVIRPEEAYTLRELAERLGVTQETLLDWKREGLPVHSRKIGSKVQLVRGCEFLEWYVRPSTTESQREAIPPPRTELETAHGRLNTKEAARYLGVATTTLEGWRTNGGGPTFYKPGRYVYYLQNDLDAWVDTRRFGNTAQAQSSKAL